MSAVAVLMGGWSEERAISLESGACVLEALKAQGVDARGIDLKSCAELTADTLNGCDRAFLALHGTGGEDGEVQAALEKLGCAYTGSDVAASRVCMDKIETKRCWEELGIPTPPYQEWTSGQPLPAADQVQLPLAVKPVAQGSSLGVTLVRQYEELSPALEEASRHAPNGHVLIEALIEGEEYTIGVLDGTPLPMIQLKPHGTFYDYHAKYEAPETEYVIPSGLPEAVEAELLDMALHAFDATGARGYGRVDLMIDTLDRPWFLEVNTLPGMRRGSLLPRAAAACGMSYEEVVLHILNTATHNGGGAA